jgi:SPW repeat
MENWTNARFCDVANLILGAILFFSPWMFGFDAGKVSQNAYLTGIVIAVLAIAASPCGIRGLGGMAEPHRRIVGAGFALGLGLPGNHRDDGPCDHRRCRSHRCGHRALDDVPVPAAAYHGPLRHCIPARRHAGGRVTAA